MTDKPCAFCKIVSKETQSEIIYEDNDFIAIVRTKAATVGHITLFPKKHHVILEQLSIKETEELFFIANKLSVVLFESLGAQGTNIILNNGIDAGQDIPHVSIDIIPRQPNDGISFEWPMKQVDPESLKDPAGKIGDALLLIEHQEKKTIKEETPKEKVVYFDDNDEKKPEERNYLIEQLNRLP